jgi:hypothetical protein
MRMTRGTEGLVLTDRDAPARYVLNGHDGCVLTLRVCRQVALDFGNLSATPTR